jgi:Ca-activated chloride channel homolog
MKKPATIRRLVASLFLSCCLLGAQQPQVFSQTSPQAPAQTPPQASSQTPKKTPQAPSDPAERIITNVNLVNVFVTVTDEHGAPIGGLKRDNFKLSEDSQEQRIAIFDKESALPLSIVLAVDTSLSTRHDLPLEQASAKRFARDIMRPVDALSVLSFSESVFQDPFTPDLRHIDSSIDHIRVGAATALFDAIYRASSTLNRRQGRKVIVLITDGGDTISRIDYKEAVRSAVEAEAIVYSIIIVPIEASAGRETGGEHALIQLSEDTGGKFYYADSTGQLDEAFKKISDELRTQYLLAYYPAAHASFSEFRRIEVKVAGVAGSESYRVRHRAGYYTLKQEF